MSCRSARTGVTGRSYVVFRMSEDNFRCCLCADVWSEGLGKYIFARQS
jgi:hypothetical protein